MVDAVASTGVTEIVTKEVEEVNQDVKYSSILSYILKPPYLLTQVFKENNKAQENIFDHMCNFGTRPVWRCGIIAASSYFDVDTSRY